MLIVSTDCPEEQINIARLALRTDAARYFPEKLHLFDLIYESRFRRLWQQFRGTEPAAARDVQPALTELSSRYRLL
jgi:hypothetical protein